MYSNFQIFQNIFKLFFQGAQLIIYPTYFSKRLKTHYSDHTVAVYNIKKGQSEHQIPVLGKLSHMQATQVSEKLILVQEFHLLLF